MTDFDDIFKQYQHTDRAVKSFKEFSNWLFGISTGICALAIFEVRNFDFSSCFMMYYKVIIILTMVNAAFTGYTKYYIIKRDINMNTKYGSLKKLVNLSKFNKKENTKDEWTRMFSEWAIEHNKVATIGNLLNASIITTLVTLIAVGLFTAVVIWTK